MPNAHLIRRCRPPCWLRSALLAPVLLCSPVPGQAADAATAPSSPRLPLGKAEVGVQAGAVRRPAVGSGVEYLLGPAWSGTARVVFSEWLGLLLQGGTESHAVRVREGVLGVPGAAQQPDVWGIRLGAELTGRWPLLRNTFAELGAGIAWARFVAPPLTAANEQLVVGERVGVVLELPVSPRIYWQPWPGQVALSLGGTFGFVLPGQTGSLFSKAGEATQALRKDTGELVTIDGLAPFANSIGAFAALHLFL